ncbi:Uncharacterized protein ygiD [Salmonella enterica subsp. arizonae]|uniref:Uncharacterized protein ygiD n=1 Tax=Salmonella enterica subsp. arizonae TaxID=59203 RepID=A0A379SQY8_SALER|nr:Uncharacterized protein ygiD [Salmonella enterica subsp. arizonae]
MSLTRMPALFLGHGSPMNVLDDNDYTHAWQRLGGSLTATTGDSGGVGAQVYPRDGRYSDGKVANSP